MMPTLHIVTTCTDRKTVKPPAGLRLRAIPKLPAAKRIGLWRNAIRAYGEHKVPARDLYCGEQWSVASRLPKFATDAGFQPRLWVASAGHGLIPGEAPIPSYSATFNLRHPDSVVPVGQSPREWWKALTSSTGGHSISRLVKTSKQDYVLVICSSAYFNALEADLREAVTIANGRVIIVSSAAIPGFESVMVRSDARLRSRLGGTLMSLNVRVAEEVIGYICRTGWDPKRVQRYVKRLVNNSPPHRRKVGRALTDEDVAAFILRATKREPIGWTRSLRLLRRSGAACEQVRFRKIFRRVEARS